jgi:hypothetical protein
MQAAVQRAAQFSVLRFDCGLCPNSSSEPTSHAHVRASGNPSSTIFMTSAPRAKRNAHAYLNSAVPVPWAPSIHCSINQARSFTFYKWWTLKFHLDPREVLKSGPRTSYPALAPPLKRGMEDHASPSISKVNVQQIPDASPEGLSASEADAPADDLHAEDHGGGTDDRR